MATFVNVEINQSTPTALIGSPIIVGDNPWQDHDDATYTILGDIAEDDYALADFLTMPLGDISPTLGWLFRFRTSTSEGVSQGLHFDLWDSPEGPLVRAFHGSILLPGSRLVTPDIYTDAEGMWFNGYTPVSFAEAVAFGTASMGAYNDSSGGNTLTVHEATLLAVVGVADSLYAPPRRLGRRNDGLHMGAGRNTGTSSIQKSLRVGSGYL